MPLIRPPGTLDRLVLPFPLLLGCVLSFLGCCLAGRLEAWHPLFKHFARFHQLIAPDSRFYPTVHEVCNLVRTEVPADRIAVLVGGNSIMQGIGQREHIWTRR